MHDWLMRNLKSFSDESLRAAAPKMGLDPNALFAETGKPEITAAIIEDSRAAQQAGLNAVPMVFVNGKWIMRTIRDEENVVLRVIEAAGRP
jgi:2-hydroxychromene-2-carboxylate isomerase